MPSFKAVTEIEKMCQHQEQIWHFFCRRLHLALHALLCYDKTARGNGNSMALVARVIIFWSSSIHKNNVCQLGVYFLIDILCFLSSWHCIFILFYSHLFFWRLVAWSRLGTSHSLISEALLSSWRRSWTSAWVNQVSDAPRFSWFWNSSQKAQYLSKLWYK